MVELIAKNYAGVLFDLANEESKVQKVGEELTEISSILNDNPKFLTFLTSPQISKKEKINSIDAVFGGRVETTTENFIKVLIENGRAVHLLDIVKYYKKLQREHSGIVYVEAITAVPMSDEQKQRLCTKLETNLGKKVELENFVEKGIMGGMKIRVGEKSLDASISGRLRAIQTELSK